MRMHDEDRQNSLRVNSKYVKCSYGASTVFVSEAELASSPGSPIFSNVHIHVCTYNIVKLEMWPGNEANANL